MSNRETHYAEVDEIRRMTSEKFHYILRNGVPVRDEEGNITHHEEPKASMMAEVNKFLLREQALREAEEAEDKAAQRIDDAEAQALADIGYEENDTVVSING